MCIRDRAELPLSDLIGMVSLGGKTGRLVVRGVDGGIVGELVFRAGRLASAAAGGLTAERAFFKLLGVTLGTFEFTAEALPIAGSLDLPTESLLMDGMRRIDEVAELSRDLPADTRLRASAGASAETALERVVLTTLARGEATVSGLLAEASRSGTGDDHDALVTLTQLQARGAIQACPPAAATPAGH
jgi:hypothetical protein